tara:strand:- start:745 stop:1551 length:807 start_codon:yes stop_codon:yes gene_type:complete
MSKAEREAQIYSRLDGTTRPLETYSVVELRGITLFYKMNIGNLGNKRKSDLIKAISNNSKYRAKTRRVEQRKIASETLEERREEKKKQVVEAREQREMEQLLQPQQTIGDAILEKGIRTADADSDWYAEELKAELSLANTEIDVDEIRVGDFLFFGYTAKFPERYEYYDRRPLALILEMKNDKILGCNVHYLNPAIRGGFARSMLNKSAIQVPKSFYKTLHSYFYGNIGSVYRIPQGEYGDIAKLVTEDFIDSNGDKYDINAVWDSVN